MNFLKALLIILLVLTVAFAVDFLTGFSVHSDVSYGDKDVNIVRPISKQKNTCQFWQVFFIIRRDR